MSVKGRTATGECCVVVGGNEVTECCVLLLWTERAVGVSQ